MELSADDEEYQSSLSPKEKRKRQLQALKDRKKGRQK
jgi:hypothetical protein